MKETDDPFKDFFRLQRGPLDLFLKFTHDSDPVTFTFIGDKKDFNETCIYVIKELNKKGMLNSFRVIIQGTVKGEVKNTMTLFNPVRNPELMTYFEGQTKL